MHSQAASVCVSVACGNGHWRTSQQIPNIHCGLRVLHCTSSKNTVAYPTLRTTMATLCGFHLKEPNHPAGCFRLYSPYLYNFVIGTLWRSESTLSRNSLEFLAWQQTERDRFTTLVRIPRYCLSVVHTNAVSQKKAENRIKRNEKKTTKQNEKSEHLENNVVYLF